MIANGRTLFILVVDDVGAMRTQIKKALDALGFDLRNVLTAANGREGFDKITVVHGRPQKAIGVCLSGWNMKPINGLQLLEMARNDPRVGGLTFIMLTAEQGSENIVAAIAAAG